jgi:negative regulator of sigma E activity
MVDKKFRSLIPAYLDGELKGQEKEEFLKALSQSVDLQKELQSYQETWEMLCEVPDVQPDPGYVSRFWRKVAAERPFWQRIWDGPINLLSASRLIPVAMTACFILIAIAVFSQSQKELSDLARLPLDVDIELLENLEFYEQYDMMEEIDFLEDLEIIENMKNGDLS